MTADASPTPLERAEAFARLFRGQANHLAFQFGGPVYLVGSFLFAEMPGDIDIRLLLAREDAVCWFGPEPDGVVDDWMQGSFQRCREELKQSRRMTRRWGRGRRRIDFQNEPILDDRPRLRLDAVPLDMLRAGRGEP